MPRIDSMFFPGGDGGALVWPSITAAVAVLHKYHPNATIWVSAQEIDAAGLETFFQTITTPAVWQHSDSLFLSRCTSRAYEAR